MVQLNKANDEGLTGKGVRVGIVDTGIDTDHPSLKDIKVKHWRDFVNSRSDPYDDYGHGTAMASIIAGKDPLPGGAQGVELVVVKVVDKDGKTTDTMIANGIDYCLDPNGDGDYRDGVDIISLSLGGRVRLIQELIGTSTQDAVNEAVAHGVLVVAAAGNDGENDDGAVARPGWYRDVICVGAVDSKGLIAPFSSQGTSFRSNPNKKPEVVAPGVDIITAFLNRDYSTGSGTSQATAFVTAALAVALSAVPELHHDAPLGGDSAAVSIVKNAVMETAKKVEGQTEPHDSHAGYGLIQAMSLANYLKATVR
jgi:subtilisin family serine protease